MNGYGYPRKHHTILLSSVTQGMLWGIALSVLAIIAFGFYIAGAMALQYRDPVNDPFYAWFYWRFWITPMVGIISMAALWIFLFEAATGVFTLRPYVFLFVVIACGGWLLYHLVAEIVAWHSCNAMNGPVPVELNCRNRDAPAKDFPDYSFIFTISGIAAFLLFDVLCIIVGGTLKLALSSTQLDAGAYSQAAVQMNTPSSEQPVYTDYVYN